MVSRIFKLRIRRQVRRSKKQAENFGKQAADRLERDFFRRLDRLTAVRRFVLSWVLLIVLLSGCLVGQLYGLGRFYQQLQPVAGGKYVEGILGTFTNANPVYATSPVDAAVSRLIFAGLFKYDEHNALVGDLAQDIAVDGRGTTYTVRLKPHLTWQDGRPLTADDVAFTFQTIQSPDAQSPLQSGWTGIKVAVVNPLAVTFTLPNVLSSFPYSLTTGIIPKHILAGTPANQLRSSSFNTTRPVGAGPFMWQALEVTGNNSENRQQQLALLPFAGYQGGSPHLDSFVIHAFRNEKQLIDSFDAQTINAMAGLLSVPPDIAKNAQAEAYSFPLTAAVMTFFKTSQGVLSDVKVRQALIKGADTKAIVQALDYAPVPVREPILRNQLGFNPAYQQAGYDLAAAKAALDQAGWTVDGKGVRHKGRDALRFKLYAEDNSDYATVATTLRKQWAAMGVDAQVILQNNADFQTTLSSHSYDALLHGISIGADPDVFVYWDSAQADPRAPHRFNFSDYKSNVADGALEAGRTRLDPGLRSAKYQPFLQAWQADAPALALYQPRFLYITHSRVFGLTEHSLNTETDRFNNVEQWMIRRVWTTPQN